MRFIFLATKPPAQNRCKMWKCDDSSIDRFLTWTDSQFAFTWFNAKNQGRSCNKQSKYSVKSPMRIDLINWRTVSSKSSTNAQCANSEKAGAVQYTGLHALSW
ncbi:hypothetical protein PoB_006790600 [Plakobranchus ocellatus]|uniref:Uncharacterized protein n=1 Tax=Plakobranchus ocellatus TaxID=259542 RepID=A0AAV4DBU2_9GAST|nr:hypothetical protein PoB_006790600 [Plakobranchus ocellatus]